MSLRRRGLLIGGALSLVLAGCATAPPIQSERETLRLDQPGEQVRLARSGRFVIQASSKEQPEIMRGGQGRFEWLSIAPALSAQTSSERQILIWLGPLGQTLGSLERKIPSAGISAVRGRGAEIKAFDAEGLMLSKAEQQQLLVALLGAEAVRFNESDIDETLALLMLSIEQISQSLESPRQFRFRIHHIDIMLRAALDPA